MYLVLGASGRTGSAVVSTLAAARQRVLAVSGTEEAAEILRARGHESTVFDLRDTAKLIAALTRCKGAYLFIPPLPGCDDFWGEVESISSTFAEAVLMAKPPNLVVLSSVAAHISSGVGLYGMSFIIEKKLRATGLPMTFIRPVEFMENWLSVKDVAEEHGVLPSFHQPLDKAYPQVSTHDVGRCVAKHLLQGTQSIKVVNLEGPEPYSPNDAARILSDSLGRAVNAICPPEQTWKETLESSGMGSSYAQALVDLYKAANSGLATFEPGVGIFERGPTTLREVLCQLSS